MTNRKIEYWIIRPDADAEFVTGMDEVRNARRKAVKKYHNGRV